MTQQFSGAGQIKTRQALVLFIKGAATPLALYTENPIADYNEIQQLLKTPTAKVIEKQAFGPIKKVSFISNQILAVAIQEEQYAQ